MSRSSSNNYRRAPSCTCLLEAYRKFPAISVAPCKCPSPDCPVRNLDSTTLHRFLEAIGGADGDDGDMSFAVANRGEGLRDYRKVPTRNRRRRME